MTKVLLAFRTVFASRSSWAVGAVSFVGFLILYLVTLPSTFTGGHIGFAALRFVTPELIGWSIGMAAILAVLMPITVYLLRQGYKAHTATGSAAGGIGLAVSLVTSLLCCTPILPIVFSFLAGFIPAFAGGTGGFFQGFLATHEWLFFTVATVILLLALFKNVGEVVKGPCCAVKKSARLPPSHPRSNEASESSRTGRS